MSKGKDLINSIKYGLYRMLTLLQIKCRYTCSITSFCICGLCGFRLRAGQPADGNRPARN